MPTMAALRSLVRLTSRSTSSRFYGQQIQQTHQYGKFKCREDLTINTMPIMMMDKRSELNHHQTLQHLQCRQYYTLSTKLLETAAITCNSHPRVQLSKKCNFKSDSTCRSGKTEAKNAAAPADLDTALFGETAKLGLFAKFKHMYKKYWYVLIPVHVITSVGWFGGFYYLSKSGVDIASLLHYLHVSESIIDKLQHSDMGHYAIAYLCYKIATPVRYAVTLGGTTVSIKLLVQAGHIKPMPTKTEFMAMIEKKKADRVQAKLDSAAEEEAAKKETKPK